MNTLLLQADAYPFLVVIFAVVGFLIGAFITRWIFRINEMHNLMRRQLEETTATRIILGRMARKEEITKDEMDKILAMVVKQK